MTLMTCTPYGVNSHRLLVRGSRVDFEDIEDMEVAMAAFSGPSIHTNYLLWVMVGLSVTGAFILFLYLYDRRRRNLAAGAGRKSGTDDCGEAGSRPEAPAAAESHAGWRDDWPEEQDEKKTD